MLWRRRERAGSTWLISSYAQERPHSMLFAKDDGSVGSYSFWEDDKALWQIEKVAGNQVCLRCAASSRSPGKLLVIGGDGSPEVAALDDNAHTLGTCPGFPEADARPFLERGRRGGSVTCFVVFFHAQFASFADTRQR